MRNLQFNYCCNRWTRKKIPLDIIEIVELREHDIREKEEFTILFSVSKQKKSVFLALLCMFVSRVNSYLISDVFAWKIR